MSLARDVIDVLKSKKKSNTSEIAEELDIAQKDVSKVIKKLKDVGIVTDDLELTPDFLEIEKYIFKS